MNVTTACETLADTLPATGCYVPKENNTPKMTVGDRSDNRHDDELLDVSSPTTRPLARFAAAREVISTLRASRIPIATTDFVTRTRRTTAVSCIEACQTPAH